MCYSVRNPPDRLVAGVFYMAKNRPLSLTGNQPARSVVDPRLQPAGRQGGPELVVGRGVSVYYEPRGTMAWNKHRHDRVQIVVALDPVEAILTWRSSGCWKRQRVSGRHGWLVPPGVVHRVRRLSHGRLVVLCVEPGYVREVCETDVKEVALLDLNMIERFDLLVWQLNKVFGVLCQRQEPVSPLFVESIGTVLAAQLLKAQLCGNSSCASRRAGLSSERLRCIMEHIESHLAGDLSRETLAAVACLSLGHFSRMFKISTSHSPHEYVMQRRQMYARELLKAGKMKKAAIAIEAGFSDQTHLGRHLKKPCRSPEGFGAR